MTFRSILKTIAKIFLGLFSLVGLCMVLWLIWMLYINLFDEPLTPEAQAMLSWRVKAVPDAENGYVMIAGFTAPAGSDWKKVGAERIARHNEQVRASRRKRSVDENEIKIPAEEETQKLKFSECDDCEKTLRLFRGDDEAALLASLQALLQQQEQIDKALSDNAELIRRYEELQSASAFSKTALPSLLEDPIWFEKGFFIPIWQILLHKVVLDALSGDREPLLNFLERDLSFWRLIMKSDTSFYTTTFSDLLLGPELRLLRTLLTKLDFSASELERLRHLLTPLSAREQSLLRAQEYDWNAYANYFLYQVDYYPTKSIFLMLLDKLLFQPQATVNLFAERIRPSKELASLSSPEFVARYDAVPDMPQEKKEIIEVVDLFQETLNYMRHGYLETTVEKARARIERFIAGRHDTAAALQLTRAVLELRLAGIDAGKNPEAVPEFLARAGEETLNPYTGKPFEWDEACRRLSFTPQYADNRDFSEVTLAEVPEENTAACAVSAASIARSRNSD